MTKVRYDNGQQVEFVCPHCGGNTIVEQTTELIECPVAVWSAEDCTPIKYAEDEEGFPLRDTRETLETQYFCGECFQEAEVASEPEEPDDDGATVG